MKKPTTVSRITNNNEQLSSSRYLGAQLIYSNGNCQKRMLRTYVAVQTIANVSPQMLIQLFQLPIQRQLGKYGTPKV